MAEKKAFLCFVPSSQGLHTKCRSLTGGGQFSLDSKEVRERPGWLSVACIDSLRKQSGSIP